MLRSPPSRRRGLKYARGPHSKKGKIVASFAEAWIEIYDVKDITIKAGSPPSRRRGLKFVPLKNSPRESGRLLRGGVD